MRLWLFVSLWLGAVAAQTASATGLAIQTPENLSGTALSVKAPGVALNISSPPILYLHTLTLTAKLEPAQVCLGQAATLTLVIHSDIWMPSELSLTAQGPGLPPAGLSWSLTHTAWLSPPLDITVTQVVTAPALGPGSGPWPWALSATATVLAPFILPPPRWPCPFCFYPISTSETALTQASPFLPSAEPPVMPLPATPNFWLQLVSTTASTNVVTISDCKRSDPDAPLIVGRAVYPNPFTDVGHFFFHLDEDAHVRLRIYNVAGEPVLTQDYDGHAGDNDLAWPGQNSWSGRCAAGVYVVYLEAQAGQRSGHYWTQAAIKR